FDHADIYGGGACESIFADALNKSSVKREDIILQSKCGIVPGKMFDFSKEHILESVEGSLSRLKTDYLDTLILHRPD
ncbi:aldo/keto reductase family oxidoreductase, partial [Streptococcus thermophilus]|nr:aldo/keto reductase family oxidoreductase [Streptococcus thermophilus]